MILALAANELIILIFLVNEEGKGDMRAAWNHWSNSWWVCFLCSITLNSQSSFYCWCTAVSSELSLKISSVVWNMKHCFDTLLQRQRMVAHVAHDCIRFFERKGGLEGVPHYLGFLSLTQACPINYLTSCAALSILLNRFFKISD